MDFRFTEEEEAFRKEVRDFLQGMLPPDWLGVDQDMCHQNEVKEIYQLGTEVRRKLAARGWLGISWPKEYGGQGAPIMKHIILEEELYYQGVPGYDQPTFGVSGPLILEFGTEEQKRRFVPPITRDLAERHNVPTHTIRAWIRQGLVRSRKVGQRWIIVE